MTPASRSISSRFPPTSRPYSFGFPVPCPPPQTSTNINLCCELCNNLVTTGLYHSCRTVLWQDWYFGKPCYKLSKSKSQSSWHLGTSSANTTCWWLPTRCEIFTRLCGLDGDDMTRASESTTCSSRSLGATPFWGLSKAIFRACRTSLWNRHLARRPVGHSTDSRLRIEMAVFE